jgi:hypothetical protein
MAIDLKPLRWDWAPVVTGDTYPATDIVESSYDSNLSRVRIKITLSGETTPSLTLDSDTSGITINDAAARDFTIDEINPVTLAAGIYAYDLEMTYANGTVRTEFAGTWEILSEITT